MVTDDDGVVATKPLAPSAFEAVMGDCSVVPSYFEWTSTLQALNIGGAPTTPGAPPNFCPPSSSPSSPYMWGNQSVIHGPPISYAALYSHGGVCTQTALSSVPVSRDADAKLLEVSDEGSKKTSKHSLGNSDLRDGSKAHADCGNADSVRNACASTKGHGDGDKATSGFVITDSSLNRDGNGAEELSRNIRDNATNPCDSSMSGRLSSDEMFPAPLKMASNLPATNNGMDLWNHSQDEREQKRQKRKLSNRESARRSRERKQKECEDLSRQVTELNSQNGDLRAEITKLNMECKKLEAENTSIVEELKQLYGPNFLAASEGEKPSVPAIRILGVECNGHGPETSSLVPLVYQTATTLPPSNGKVL